MMKSVLFVAIFLNFNVSAQSVQGGESQFQNWLDRNKPHKAFIEFHIVQERSVTREGLTCERCPSHLKLTRDVNTVLKKLAASHPHPALPKEINQLDFLYGEITTLSSSENPSPCPYRFYPSVPFSSQSALPKKEFMTFLGEQFFKFDALAYLMLQNPHDESVRYYYRASEGKNKSNPLIVEAIAQKNGDMYFRYYRYEPNESYLNPYRLPELSVEKSKIELVPQEQRLKQKFGLSLEAQPDAINFFILDPYVERRQNGTPRDVVLLKAGGSLEVPSGLSLTGVTQMSLRGHRSEVALHKGKKEYIVLETQMKPGDKLHYRIGLPVEIDFDSLFATPVKNVSTQVNIGTEGRGFKISGETENLKASVDVLEKKDLSKATYVLNLEYRHPQTHNRSIATVGRDHQGQSFSNFQHIRGEKDSHSLVMGLKQSTGTQEVYFRLLHVWR
jgi:hypothetical protein